MPEDEEEDSGDAGTSDFATVSEKRNTSDAR